MVVLTVDLIVKIGSMDLAMPKVGDCRVVNWQMLIEMADEYVRGPSFERLPG